MKPPKLEMIPVNSDDYPHLLVEIKERIRSAQYAALKAVNKELVGLYWDIGRMIVERQENAGWGQGVVDKLAADIRAEFPGIAGFSRRNMFYMRDFYLLYSQDKKVQPLAAQIGWSHNLAIMGRCKDALEREFYLRMTKKFGWSKNVLIHQIENQSYEKAMLNQTNFDRALTWLSRQKYHNGDACMLRGQRFERKSSRQGEGFLAKHRLYERQKTF